MNVVLIGKKKKEERRKKKDIVYLFLDFDQQDKQYTQRKHWSPIDQQHTFCNPNWKQRFDLGICQRYKVGRDFYCWPMRGLGDT